MQHLTKQIMDYAERLPEGMPIVAKNLLHLGSRANVNRALSRLATCEQLMRAERGLYLCPVKSRFGVRPPGVEKTIDALAVHLRETFLPCGAASANLVRLSTQIPMRYIYLTSGRSRILTIGTQCVKLRHTPRWQLALGNSTAGRAVCALVWFGPKRAEANLQILKRKLPSTVFDELVAAAPQFPTWLAQNINRVAHG